MLWLILPPFSASPLLLQALANIAATLVPGSGRVLFRDYAEGDLAQLRLEGQGAKLISRGFYARGDGTCCYYFDEVGAGAVTVYCMGWFACL
jgi:hypothetical protein